MKKIIAIALLSFTALVVKAQRMVMSVGSGTTLTISSGTIFSIDSLVLTPSGGSYTMSNTSVQVSPLAVAVAGMPGISRVYTLSNPIVFTGMVQVYYQLSELNGNTEASLIYSDTAMSAVWATESTGSVNMTSHYVQYAAASKSFNGATGSPMQILPLSLLSFAGSWNQQYPLLSWVIDQSGEALQFVVQRSEDGQAWADAGSVDGTAATAVRTYGYTDAGLDGVASAGGGPATLFYRIKIGELSGRTIYSNVLKLQKTGTDNDLLVGVGGNSVLVRFKGEQPSAIRLINAAGQVLVREETSRSEYAFGALKPGVYFLQYNTGGQWAVRKFAVR